MQHRALRRIESKFQPGTYHFYREAMNLSTMGNSQGEGVCCPGSAITDRVTIRDWGKDGRLGRPELVEKILSLSGERKRQREREGGGEGERGREGGRRYREEEKEGRGKREKRKKREEERDREREGERYRESEGEGE